MTQSLMKILHGSCSSNHLTASWVRVSRELSLHDAFDECAEMCLGVR